MYLYISVLVFILIIMLVIPYEKLFPSRNLRKLIRVLDEDRHNSILQNSSFINRFLIFSEKVYKALRINLRPQRYATYKNRISISGKSDKLSVEAFVGSKIMLSIISFFYVFVFLLVQNSTLTLMLLIITPLIGYNVPDSILTRHIRKRQWNIQVELPYVLNTLAIITEAGLTFFEAIRKICDTREGILVSEFKKVLDEINLGILQRDALYRMAERCEVNEVSIFVFTLAQSLEKGASGISVTLKEQAEEAWSKRKFKAKELGEKASIKLFFPMLLLVFPSLGIFLLGPAIISILKILTMR